MDLGVWDRWLTRFFTTWLEPGGDPGSGLPLAQTTLAAKRSLFPPHLRPSPGPSDLPSFLHLCPICPLVARAGVYRGKDS